MRLAPPAPRVVRRRIVLLCDISRLDGALRAGVPAVPHLCAGSGRRGGVRVRDAADAASPARCATRNPERAIQRAAAAAPDWSSGTRIGEALKRVQRSPRPPRDGARRGDRDAVRRLGARRPGAGRARDGAAGAARVPDRVGQPARRRGGLRAPGRRDGGGAAVLDALVSGHSLDALRRGDRGDRRASAARASWTPPEPEEPTRSRGRARRRCPAARSRCRAATARAAAGRRPDGA